MTAQDYRGIRGRTGDVDATRARGPTPRGDGRGRGAPAARWRVWVLVGALGLGFLGVLWKSARLQLVLGDDLRALAEEQYLRAVTVTAPRGAILDKDGRHLAVSLPAWSVFAEPRRIVDVDGTAERLARALALPLPEVKNKIDSDRAFVWLSRRASPEVAEAVRALDLPGVGLRKEWRRTWPNKQLAAQVLGAVDIDGNGRGGVEQSLDERLVGRSTRLMTVADNRGDRIAVVEQAQEVFDLATIAGDEVVVTLDLPLQQAAEEVLERTRHTFDAKAAWAIVLDVETGAIRVAAQSPPFNPNTNEGDRRNHAIADAFEPGSTFKIATFAAALDAGAVRPGDLIDCENGRYRLGRHTIHDTHRSGVVTARDVFKYSSNIGTLKIAERLGEDRFKDAIARYGFGSRPGTGLLDETAGRLPKVARLGQTRLATMSFGHGLMVSTLQMASLLQAIGNGGVRHQPYLVERVQAAAGAVVESHEVDAGERVMSTEAASALIQIMESVVEPGGTGALAAIPGVRVAGKTGTAEKVDPVTGRYSKELNLSSFLGMAPAEAPRVVAVVVVDEPKGVHFGGPVAGPAWRAIVERALLLDGASGTANLEVSLKKASKQPSARPALVEVVEHPAAAGDAHGATTPDVRGLSARAALAALSAANGEVEVRGHGRVVAQEPAPGAPLPQNQERVQLTLALGSAGAAP